MRREKVKNKNSDAEEHNENDIDAPSSPSSEFVQDTDNESVHAAALLAATADGAQIDDDGQKHNVDSAIQYVDESDTVRRDDEAARPQFAHLRAEHDTNYEHASSTVMDHNNSIHETTLRSSSSTTRASNSNEKEITADVNDDNSAEQVTIMATPPRSTMEPPLLRDVVATSSASAAAAPLPLPPRPPTVMVESERVELIEIKSDGSTGHLTPAGYR